jgi:hypothetical protein
MTGTYRHLGWSGRQHSSSRALGQLQSNKPRRTHQALNQLDWLLGQPNYSGTHFMGLGLESG